MGKFILYSEQRVEQITDDIELILGIKDQVEIEIGPRFRFWNIFKYSLGVQHLRMEREMMRSP